MKSISATIKILIFVILGILLNDNINVYLISSNHIFLLQLFLILLLSCLVFNPVLESLLIYFLFFIIAFNALNINFRNKLDILEFIKSYEGHNIAVTAKVNSLKFNSYGSNITANLLNIGDKEIDSLNIPIQIIIKGKFDSIQKNKIIKYTGSISQITKPTNPSTFNAEQFYSRKGIYIQSFIDIDNIKSVDNPTNGVNILNNIRSYIEKTIKSSFNNTQHAAIALALCLGDKSDMNKETKDIFINTGSIHVLAVSGLHVGIIYTIVMSVLRFVNFSQRNERIQTIMLIVFLMIYALLTNYPNSVVRATLMLSIYLIGKSIYRYTSPYHVVGLSALVILLWHPNALFQISFQFSYLALLGIMFFYTKMSLKQLTKSRIANYLLQIILVSVSAQILILPISIYHFNQFSVYFWLSSLIAIPLAFATIVLSILVLLMNLISIPIVINLKSVIAYLLENLVCIFAKAIKTIECLPYGLLTDLYIHPICTIVLYLIIGSIILLINTRKYIFLLTALALLITQYSIQFIHRKQAWNSTAIEIYHRHKNSILVLSNQGKSFSNKIGTQDSKIDHIITKRKLHNYNTYPETKFTNSKSGLYNYNDKYFFVHPPKIPQDNDSDIRIEFALINNMDTLEAERLRNLFNPHTIITDGLTQRKNRLDLSKWSKTKNINYHDTYRDGYYKIILE